MGAYIHSSPKDVHILSFYHFHIKSTWPCIDGIDCMCCVLMLLGQILSQGISETVKGEFPNYWTMLISQWVTLARMASDLGHLISFFWRGVYNFYETMPMGLLIHTWILSIVHCKAHCFCCLPPAMRLLGDICIFAGAT